MLQSTAQPSDFRPACVLESLSAPAYLLAPSRQLQSLSSSAPRAHSAWRPDVARREIRPSWATSRPPGVQGNTLPSSTKAQHLRVQNGAVSLEDAGRDEGGTALALARAGWARKRNLAIRAVVSYDPRLVSTLFTVDDSVHTAWRRYPPTSCKMMLGDMHHAVHTT